MIIENNFEQNIPEGAVKTDNWKELPPFVLSNQFAYKNLETGGETHKVAPNYANLVTSKVYEIDGVDFHTPILDLDLDAKLLPSTTHGHYHLYIDKVMPEEDYRKLIDVLVEVGILQKGIKEYQMDEEGFTAARLPGIKKQKNDISSGKASGKTSFGGTIPTTKEDKIQGPVFGVQSVTVTPLTDPTEDATIEQFERLAKIATQTGQSLAEVTEHFIKYKKSLSELNNSAQNKPKVSADPWGQAVQQDPWADPDSDPF